MMDLRNETTETFAGITVWSADLPDGRKLVMLTQDDERAAPEDITGLERVQLWFGKKGESIAILEEAQWAVLRHALNLL